jgi:hypothetical protein
LGYARGERLNYRHNKECSRLQGIFGVIHGYNSANYFVHSNYGRVFMSDIVQDRNERVALDLLKVVLGARVKEPAEVLELYQQCFTTVYGAKAKAVQKNI